MKQFKILKNYKDKRLFPEYFPWHLLNEEMAQKNHSQSLERLNERGGLSVDEITCNIKKISIREIFNLNVEDCYIFVQEQIDAAASFGKNNGLLPCPFCGSEEGENVMLGYEYPKYRITCIPCSIIMKHDRKDKVKEYWNKRV